MELVIIFCLLALVIAAGWLTVSACVVWVENDDYDTEDEGEKYDTIPTSIVTRSGPMYVVEKVIDQRGSGIKVLLTRCATPLATNSICYSMCEPRVVIKMVPRVPPSKTKKYVWNVHHEIAAMQLAENIPGVVDLIEYTQDDLYTYLVMSYLPGGDLFARVDKTTKGLDEATARIYFQSIVSSLTKMKQLGLAHHDISLDNMMLDDDDKVHLIDLGMSIKTESDTVTALAVPHLYGGKSSYIAPELAHMKSAVNVFAADVWSLGVCLYNMLTAAPLYERPFDSTFSTMEKRGGMMSILKSDEKYYGRHFSPQVKKLLCWMLDPDPRRRPSFEQILDHPFLTCAEDSGADTKSGDSFLSSIAKALRYY